MQEILKCRFFTIEHIDMLNDQEKNIKSLKLIVDDYEILKESLKKNKNHFIETENGEII